MEKVAVLPVPDWACAITSCPLTTGTIARCWIAEGRSKLRAGGKNQLTLRLSFEKHSPVSINASEQLCLQIHVVKAGLSRYQ